MIKVARMLNLREHILNTAKDIATNQGLENINVRLVAKESGVALGTIYNYYPAKDNIIVAVIDDFWQSAFADIDLEQIKQLDFITALERIYYHLLEHLASFKQNWLEQLTLLNINDKSIGRAKEREYLERTCGLILISLDKDEGALKNYSSGERAKISEFVFYNMLEMLKQGNQDFSLFKKMLSKIIE